MRMPETKVDILARLKTECVKAKANAITRMVPFMKATGSIINQKAMVLKTGLMVAFLRALGTLACHMDVES